MGLCSVVLAVPLTVLGMAAGPYDDAKAWALPLLVTATALFWLLRARKPLLREGSPVDRGARLLRWAILAYLGWWVVTTVTSIAPGQSILGSFGRGMGLLTVGSAGLLFFLVQSECRTPEAMRCLIDAALLGSVPVCLLALGQAIGWDPLPRSWDPAVAKLTVRSTFGQHIFLGSYLVLLVPLAAARLDGSLRRWQASEPGGARLPLRALLLSALWVAGALSLVELASHWAPAWWGLVPWGLAGALVVAVAGDPIERSGRAMVAVALLGTVTVAQVLVVVLSRARGPLLGLLFGLSVAGLTLLARRRAWRALGLGAAAVAALVTALVLLNVPHSALAPLARMPALSRLSQLTNVRRGTPVWFRVRVWSGLLDGWGRQLRGEEVIPGTRPWVRTALGYGLETQLLTLDRLSLPSLGVLEARGEGWRGQYLVDRAHNALLDHLLTGGLIGAGLWVTLVGLLLAVAVSRVRGAGSGEEMSLRLGCLGAILGHLAEGQVGIVTTMPLALFWMTAGLLASAPWPPAGTRSSGVSRTWRPHRSWPTLAVVAVALAAVLVAWISTRWLLASIAYSDGTRRYIAGQTAAAYADFRRSRERAPWLPVPAEAFAYTALRLAGSESSPARQLDFLHDGEAALAEARRHALGGSASWTLTAQLTFAEARAGERSKLPVSLEAFEAAARLRPQDPQIMAQWGWAWLESGDPGRARQAAERAVALSAGHPEWLPWAVLARSARELGDGEEARRAAHNARNLAPAEARRLLEVFVP